jgi:hypothetical protein
MHTTHEDVYLHTSLMGYSNMCSREELELAFGEPILDGLSLDGKTTVEWNITFDDGIVATIYDWKRTVPPARDEWIRWNIGGRHSLAVTRVDDAVKRVRERAQSVI